MVTLIQQNLRIRGLLETVMRIHNITTRQADPPIFPKNKGVGGKKEGAKPKKPFAYQKLPQDDKNIPMSEFPKEKNGLPNPKGTTETSFIDGIPSGRVKNMDSLNMELAHETIQAQYSQYGKDGNILTLEVKDGKVFSFGPRGGMTILFQADGRTLNPQLLKLKKKNVQKTLGPHWTE